MTKPKIFACSDLHTDVNRATDVIDLLPEDADYLILAGDLSSTIQDLKTQIPRLSKKYTEVIYVPGNHESYRRSIEDTSKRLHRIADPLENVHVLIRDEYWLENQRYLGCTLWYPLPSNYRLYREQYMDLKRITSIGTTVPDEHKKDINFLRNNTTPDDIVITHMVPTEYCTNPQYRTNPLTSLFYVIYQADKIITINKPKIWICGHTHYATRKIINETSFVNNPYGYEMLNEQQNFSTALLYNNGRKN